MKKTVRNGMIFLLFIGVNGYLGLSLTSRLTQFRYDIMPVHMQIMKETTPRLAGVIDADQDGEDELFFSTPWGSSPRRQQMSVFEPFEKNYLTGYYGQILVPENYTFFDIYYDNETKTYIFRFLEFNNGIFFIHDMDNRHHLRKTLPLQKTRKKPAGNAGFKGPFLVDIDGNRENELVVILKPTDYTPPGGLVCFDPKSGKLLWEYYPGTAIENAEFVDIDSDGKKEIVLSTFACHQGKTLDGMSDSYSYAIVLDSKGNERWNQKIGDWETHTHALAADVDNDGSPEILCVTEIKGIREYEKGKVVILDARNGEPKNQLPVKFISYSKPLISKYNKNKSHIYIGDSEGNLLMFDGNLNQLNSVHEKGPIKVLNSASIAGELDFIFTFSQDKLMVFTKDLSKKVFTFEFKGTNPEKANLEDSIFIPLRTKRGNYALVIYDKLYMLQFSRLTFKDIFRRALKSGWPFILITLLVFNSYWVYMLYSLDIITKTHHKKKTRMDVSQFLDIARGIAHQVKNPLSTILWTAEKIKRSVAGQQDNTCIETAVDTAGFAQLAEFLMEDVKILKQQTNNLLKLIQIYKPSIREVNLKPLLQGLVTHYRSLVSEEINILLEMDDEITLCIDDQLIKEALLNLVDNAVDAMPAGGQLRISVVPVTSPAQGSVGEILIEVEDTGCGMDEEGLAKLFTPFFTKKEKGTGLGLIICKRIIESHGGIINVHSRKDFGTKIAITIPVKTAKGGTL